MKFYSITIFWCKVALIIPSHYISTMTWWCKYCFWIFREGWAKFRRGSLKLEDDMFKIFLEHRKVKYGPKILNFCPIPPIYFNENLSNGRLSKVTNFRSRDLHSLKSICLSIKSTFIWVTNLQKWLRTPSK